MLKVNTNISFDIKRAAAALREASDSALTTMGVQALKDVSQYVPKDQDVLKDSGLNHSDIKAENEIFTMRWDTPYAQYLWHGDVMHGNPAKRSYGPEKLSFTSALAREEWAKYAQEVYGEEWKEVYQAALRMEMKK